MYKSKRKERRVVRPLAGKHNPRLCLAWGGNGIGTAFALLETSNHKANMQSKRRDNGACRIRALLSGVPLTGDQPKDGSPPLPNQTVFLHSAARAGNKKIKIHVRAVVKQFVKRHNHLQASIAIDL